MLALCLREASSLGSLLGGKPHVGDSALIATRIFSVVLHGALVALDSVTGWGLGTHVGTFGVLGAFRAKRRLLTLSLLRISQNQRSPGLISRQELLSIFLLSVLLMMLKLFSIMSSLFSTRPLTPLSTVEP